LSIEVGSHALACCRKHLLDGSVCRARGEHGAYRFRQRQPLAGSAEGIAPGWRPLVDITGANALFEEHYKDYGERQVVRFLIADERNSGSILAALVAARENCRTIRDFVPREAWELLNEIYLFAREDLPKG
jgi:uncharacterized alpha-E superfamily protein